MSIHICHISSAHQRDDTRIFKKECCSLKKYFKSAKVTLLIADKEKNEIIEEISIIGHKKQKNRYFRFLFTPFNLLKTAIKIKADIYHIHDPELIFTGLILKTLRFRVIYDAHEDLPRQILGKYWIHSYLRVPVSFIAEFVENFVVKRLDHIFTATEYIRDRFIKISPNVDDLLNYPILNNTLDINSIDFSKKENSICYVGNITKIRGMIPLINALCRSNCERLYLIGPIAPSGFEKELKILKGWDKVQYLGFQNKEDIIDIFKKSKAGVITFLPLPNHINACPNKFFEYMQLGLPIIASNFKRWENIIKPYNTGYLVDPESEESILIAINKIMNLTTTDLRVLGENGINAVINKYNWNIEEEKLIKVYKKILKI